MSNNQYRSNYVPAIVPDDISPPPPPQPEPPPIRDSVRGDTAWFILVLSIVLMTLFLFSAMLIDGSSTRQAITAGTRFFTATIGLVVFVLSGTLTDILRAWWHSRTERRRIDAWADLGEQAIRWRQSVEDNRRLELERDNLPATLSKRLNEIDAKLDEVYYPPRAEGVQPPPDVAPYDNRGKAAFAKELHPVDTTRDEAIAWARKLYNDLGEPHPHYVQLSGRAVGRIQNTDIIGSARGKGSAEARLWLLQRRILLKRPGGYSLNLDLVPTERDLRYIE